MIKLLRITVEKLLPVGGEIANMTYKSLLKSITCTVILTMSFLATSSLAQNGPSPVRDGNVIIPANDFDQSSIEEDYESVALYNDREFIFSTGYDYSSGKFNLPTNTNISYIPYSLKYTEGSLSFRASSGYISFASPRNVVTAVEGTPLVTDVDLTVGERQRSSRKSGFGDIYLSGTYSIENPYSNDLFVDFTARVKIPTANENRGLGTGKVDYSVQVDAAYLFGNFMPFGTLGYRFIGKTDLYDLQNSFYASIGLAYYLTYDTSIGVSYDYRESATPGFNSPKEIFAYTDVQINDHWGINLYGVVGLNNVTTDYGVGTQLRYKF